MNGLWRSLAAGERRPCAAINYDDRRPLRPLSSAALKQSESIQRVLDLCGDVKPKHCK